MKKLVLSLLAAFFMAAGIIAVPLSASAAGGNSDMCYGPGYTTCSWQASVALEAKTSGSFTSIVAVAHGNFYYLKQSGRSACITWNVSKTYFDQITCSGVKSQEFAFAVISGSNIYAIENEYYTEYCLTGEGSGHNIGLSPCPVNTSPAQQWKWAFIT